MASQRIRRQINLKPGGTGKLKKSWPSPRLLQIGREFAAIARGPWFLSAISVILLLTIPAAQAAFLKGCVQTDIFSPDNAARAQESNLPQSRHAQDDPACASGGGGADSFPVSFAGTWRCVTVVVGSALPAVPVGETIESAVSFIKQPDGRILALWEQPGWTEAKQHVSTVSDHEAQMERTNYFLQPGQDGQWAAHSRDHYLRLDNNRMTAESKVDQFVAGQFMGRYETRSMLYRLDIAMGRGSNGTPLP